MKSTDDAVLALGFPFTQYVDARTVRLVSELLTREVLTNPDLGDEGAAAIQGFVALLSTIEATRSLHERNREVRRTEGTVARVEWVSATSHNNGDTPIGGGQ